MKAIPHMEDNKNELIWEMLVDKNMVEKTDF